MTEKWTEIGNLKFPRFDHTIDVIGDKLYIVGGSEKTFEYCDLLNGFGCSLVTDAKFEQKDYPTLYGFYPSKCELGNPHFFKASKICEISVCADGWSSFLIGDEINCLKNVGLIQLKEATSYCKLFNANQILPRSRQESNDLIAALSSLDLDSQNNETLVSIDIYKTKEGEWHDSAGQPISYFNRINLTISAKI